MMTKTLLSGVALVGLLTSCVSTDVDLASAQDDAADENLGTTNDSITTAGKWFRLDSANGLGAATLTAMNGAKALCPSGRRQRTCQATALVLPPGCNFECSDGLLSLQGESLVRGSFVGGTFVIEAGFDTWRRGKGRYSVYQLTGSPTCAADPCPGSLSVQKLNGPASSTKVSSVDLSKADDPTFAQDPTLADAQSLSPTGLLASGKVIAGVFVADRIWRLETPAAACDPQTVARVQAGNAGDSLFKQFRTIAVAERAVNPDPDGNGVSWLVRNGESATSASFTSGRNDLWSQEFDVNKLTCQITVTGEH
jgi:hypothetical protein